MDQRTVRDIAAEAKSIISRVSRIDVAEMKDDVLFRDELGIDSLMGMEIIASCEKHLGVTIDETALARIEHVGEFMDLLRAAHRAAGSPEGRD